MNLHDSDEPLTQSFTGGKQKYIGFALKDVLFAVDILSVHEVIRTADLSSIPNCPDYVEGLMKLRGNIFPLIDLGRLFAVSDRAADPGRSSIIILENRGKLTGIRVDAVTSVLDIDPDSLDHNAIPTQGGIDSRFIAGIFSAGEKMVILPDFDRILSGYA